MLDSISIVIPTHHHDGRNGDLVCLLQSLNKLEGIKNIIEIIIVDNGCTLENTVFLNLSTKIKIIKEPRIGLNNARNSGLKEALGQIVAFLDDDVVVSPKWVNGILSGFTNGALCVGGPVLIKELNNEYPRWFSPYFLRFLLPPSYPRTEGVLMPPYYLIGSNMSFRRNVFDNYGAFDQSLDRKGNNLLSNGDTEFILRLPPQKVWFAPQALAYEKIPETRLTRKFMVRRLFWQGISDRILIEKNGHVSFYDRHEIALTRYFIKDLSSAAIKGNFFEATCRIIRLAGFYSGNKNQTTVKTIV